MTRRAALAFALLLLPATAAAAEAPKAQWVAVTAPAYRAALEPLCARRKAQGLRVVVVTTTDVLDEREAAAGGADKLRRHVNALCRAFPGTSYILLLGAVPGGQLTDAVRKVVPALPGTAGRMKGEPSDNGYGCPGEGLLPTVAVGRLPARTEEEARQMVRKTLDYESDRRPGAWRRRLTVLAGAPEFSPALDALVERLALAQLARIDPSWQGRAIYHNPQSRFSLPDDLCHERALAYVQQGQALTLYLGHSNARGFYANGSGYLDRDDWANLSIAHGPGVLATFGCLGCQLAGRDGEGYGVAAARNPRGPAAVLGSHGVCFAAMVKLASEAFADSFLGPHPPDRLGESWLRLKQGLAKGKMDPITFRLLDAVDGDSRIPQAVQRQEHLEMFVLLGDPALRLPSLPGDVKLTVTGPPGPGAKVVVRGTVPERLEGAEVSLTVERPRDSDPPGGTALPEGPAAARAKAMIERHERANDFVVVGKQLRVKDGRFAAELALPADLPWRRLTVRAYAATPREEGLGVLPLDVKPVKPGEN
jgi:hypothetical protein